MTLLFVDSFDHYASAELELKWTAKGSATTVIDGSNGRNSTAGLNAGSTAGSVRKTLPGGAKATLIAGVGFKPNAFTAIRQVLGFMDGASVQCDVRVTTSGTLTITRNGTVLATGTTVLSLGVYYYIELKATIHDSTGSAVLRINSVQELSVSGVDTKNTANASADGVQLGGNGQMYFDDLYVCDDNGSVNNDFLGDIRVEAILPSGAGNSAQWTPSAGANYENVDETPPDEDTTYNSSLTPTNLDLFAMANLVSTSGSIKGIQTLRYTRKDDAGARIIRRAIRTGATNYFGSNESISLQTYAYFHEIVENNPNTTNPWTISEVNAIEAGYELVS